MNDIGPKGCGLLSKMLSLPDEWDYTTRGLAALCKDGVDSIGTALKELEARGYLVRHKIRDEHGRIKDTEYVIYETPYPLQPDTENPDTVIPDMVAPCPENPAQLNTHEVTTQESITDQSITHSFFPSGSALDGRKDGNQIRQEIKLQISYDFILPTCSSPAQLDELVELMVEVAMNRSPIIKIGRDAEYPTSYVRERFGKITSEHIEKVLDGIKENTTRVWNTRAYLLSALFNSVSTIDNYYTMLVNHDLSCG